MTRITSSAKGYLSIIYNQEEQPAELSSNNQCVKVNSPILQPAVMVAKQAHHHLCNHEWRNLHNSFDTHGYMGYETVHLDHEDNHTEQNSPTH